MTKRRLFGVVLTIISTAFWFEAAHEVWNFYTLNPDADARLIPISAIVAFMLVFPSIKLLHSPAKEE